MPRRYWLMKSEPDVYSIDDLARDKRTSWTNVRNFKARNFMRDEIKPGDLAFFYHSNADPSAVVGIMDVCAPPQPDETQFDAKDAEYHDAKATRENPIWWASQVAFVEKLPRAVSLHEIKAEPRLAEMALLKYSRLSVTPVTETEWNLVLEMAGARKL